MATTTKRKIEIIKSILGRGQSLSILMELAELDKTKDLIGTELSNIVVTTNDDLSGYNFTRANLSNTDLSACNLTNANFTEAKLCGTNFKNCILTNAVFTNAKFS